MNQIEQINIRLSRIHMRLQQIADVTAQQAMTGAAHPGNPAFVALMDEQLKLIEASEKLVDAAEKLLGMQEG